MQDDGKKAIEDDLIDDDMDFGDFDDDFDEDLDLDVGLDDDAGANLGVDDWEDVDGDGSLDSNSPKDSFVKKNFNLIVIAVAVLGGGGFVMSQMGGAPTPVPVDVDVNNSAEIVDVDMGEMPPAPASVDAGAPAVGFSGLPPENDVESARAVDDSALTPLPTFDGEQPDLAPLDFLTHDDASVSEDAVDDVVSQLPSESPLDGFIENGDEEFDADLEAVIDDPLAELASDSVDEPIVESAIDVKPVQEFAELPALDAVSTPSAHVADDNAALIKELREENDAKDAMIAEANAQVSDLEGTVYDLKAELDAVKASLNETRALQNKRVAAPVVTADVVEDMPVKTVVAAPAKKPAVEVKTRAPAVKAKWVLRAAQPGKAMIYNDSTQDVLSVETGDVVAGIGVVKSISVQNGLWVVRGTKGRITQ